MAGGRPGNPGMPGAPMAPGAPFRPGFPCAPGAPGRQQFSQPACLFSLLTCVMVIFMGTLEAAFWYSLISLIASLTAPLQMSTSDLISYCLCEM
jgi:hypothetical protein